MRILLIGQCTLHLGRMEFGNIGNYYILEPFIRELHRCFNDAEIRTTFQVSQEFCDRERVVRLPMRLYYDWSESVLSTALMEIEIAESYKSTGKLDGVTPYIEEVIGSDLVIDFSGDLWGDNANFLGKDRFLIGLYKNRVAQLFGAKTAMLAGSPGPFGDLETLSVAKKVFADFDLVTNREAVSRRILEENGFKTSHVVDLACPAFLFEPAKGRAVEKIVYEEGLNRGDKPVVGFILCGWNFTDGPFDKWPRDEGEYFPFVNAIEFLIQKLDVRVCLMSHSNGFKLPAPPFELIHGRDFPIIKQLQSVLRNRGINEGVFSLDGIYSPAETKAIIGHFDMLVSGRIHAAVAGLSQCVPTVAIDYGHEPKAHKLQGFMAVADMEQYLADPIENNLVDVIEKVWFARDDIRAFLKTKIPKVRLMAKRNFEMLKQIF